MATRTITCSRLARTRGVAALANFNNKNWGLIRHTNNANAFPALSYGGDSESHTYTYDDTNGQGENVDIIFITGGMIYTDNAGYKTGGSSRIQQYDWRGLTGSPTSVNVDYSTSASRSEHSEAVVASACHNDYGAATKANIYIIPTSQIISSTHYWVLPKLFHQQKGNSNPTLVVNSFGETSILQFVKNLTFRGTTYSSINGKNFPSGDTQSPSGMSSNTKFRNPRPADDVLLKEMTDAGVIHICSAGNSIGKLDVDGGLDYNNKYLNFFSGQETFINRPTFANEDTITVGNLDSWFNDGNTAVTNTGDFKEVCLFNGEFALNSSNMGPAVDCFVAGTNIPIIIPTKSDHSANKNTLNDGTSFSAPTLAGLVSMVLSKYPTTTAAQMRKYVRDVAVSAAPMGNPVVLPTESDGDKGNPEYFDWMTSKNSNLKITYIDPSLSYDTSSITNTTITYATETLQPLSPSPSNNATTMPTRTYGNLFKTASALIGTGGQLDVTEQDQLSHLINRRFQQAFDESPVWPRYLVSSEARDINSHTLSGATASTSTAVNQNYRLLGVNDGDIGKEGTNVYIGVTTASGLIYKSASNAWLVVTGGAHAVNADGTIDITTAGTTQFTEADTNKKDTLESVEVWTPRAGSDVLSIVSKNLIPYAQTGKDTIGDFNRIHRTRAFQNNSSMEYDFFVDFNGANILNIANSTDNEAFVSYKKQFTPFTVTSDYYNSTEEVPSEFFNYIAHTVYADFLRVQNRQEQALAEEQVAQTYLALELEKIDIRSNNNTINKRFSTYINRQSR